MKKFIVLLFLFSSLISLSFKYVNEQSVSSEKAKLQINNGTVNAKICWPGEITPQLIIYIKNVQTNKIIKITTEETFEECKIYSIKEIPSGTYIAYVYTKETGMYENFGGYSGYNVNTKIPDKRELKKFTVDSDKITNILINDFYEGLNIPQR
jgi:hypothetical protein